jgi:hypothetical protein
MATFEVAHIKEQGQDIIIVLLKSSFGRKPQDEKNEIALMLQRCATSAGLAGTVVPVWDEGGGRMGFLAPKPWHPFFRSITLRHVAININKKLTCS